jgi:hypothetical protein
MLLQLRERNIGLCFDSLAQHPVLSLCQRRLAASTVRYGSDRARLSFLTKHLFNKGLSDIELFGDLRGGACALIIGGNHSLSQI